jgi:anti-anti-sigma regulatory factor
VLRITIQNASNAVVLKLEGSVKGPWVEELQKAWLTSAIMSDGEPVSVDLGGVSFVDTRGRDLLLRMQKEGVVLKRASSFLRQMLEDGSGKVQTVLAKDRSSQ